MKKWIGVLGYPLTHSLSKSFHEKKLKEQGLDVDFRLLEWEPSFFESKIISLKQDPFCIGFSVTMPFKEKIAPYIDEFDPLSAKTGVVNAVKNREGRWLGFNTDGPSFLESLQKWQPMPPTSATVVFLGAGATAKTLSFVLAEAGYHQFIFINRNYEKSFSLKNNLFILNTTPVSTADDFWKNLNIEKLRPPIWFFDVIYNPSPTWLFNQFRQRSFYVMNGYDMFEAQAKRSFLEWFSGAQKGRARRLSFLGLALFGLGKI